MLQPPVFQVESSGWGGHCVCFSNGPDLISSSLPMLGRWVMQTYFGVSFFLFLLSWFPPSCSLQSPSQKSLVHMGLSQIAFDGTQTKTLPLSVYSKILMNLEVEMNFEVEMFHCWPCLHGGCRKRIGNTTGVLMFYSPSETLSHMRA